MTYTTITIDLLKILFKKFNETFFHNTLPTPKFRVATTKTRLGCFSYNAVKRVKEIMISDYYKVSMADIENTMLHEMIHLWEWEKYKKCTHGKTFKNMANLISQLSNGKYIITRTTSRNGFTLSDNAHHKVLTAKKTYPTFMVGIERNGSEPYAWIVKVSKPLLNSLQWETRVGNIEILGYVVEWKGEDFQNLPQCRASIRGKKMLWNLFSENHAEFANSIASL